MSHERCGILDYRKLQDIRADLKEDSKVLYYWAFVRGVRCWLAESPHNEPAMWKVFASHDLCIMSIVT